MDNFASRGHYQRAGVDRGEKKNLWPFTIIFAQSYFVGVLIFNASENLTAFQRSRKKGNGYIPLYKIIHLKP